MPDISSFPEEVLLHIFSFLPTSSLISVWRTSRQWRDLSRRLLAASIQSYLADSRYNNLSDDKLDIAADLITSRYMSEDFTATLATRVQECFPKIGHSNSPHKNDNDNDDGDDDDDDDDMQCCTLSLVISQHEVMMIMIMMMMMMVMMMMMTCSAALYH